MGTRGDHGIMWLRVAVHPRELRGFTNGGICVPHKFNSLISYITQARDPPPRGTTQKAKKKKRKCHVRMSLSQLDKKGSSLLAALLGPRRSVCITELEGRWEPKTSGGTVVFPVHLK